ncbi:MAG: fumarate hydratase [Promethearchaeota archaeon]
MKNIETQIVDSLVQGLTLAATRPRKDVLGSLKNAYNRESNALAKEQLGFIIKNMELGSQLSLPYCQDTGSILISLKLGDAFPLRSKIITLLEEAIIKATNAIPLRPNTVDPVEDRNFGNNIGTCMPRTDVALVSGSTLELDIILKGGGADNMSKMYMLPPINAWNKLPEIVRKLVIDSGGKPCPPIIIGIGVGGTASSCMDIAKKALFRELGMHNENPEIKELETEILKNVNETGIGVMGLGGDTTCLAVNIETCSRHPASFPVGIIVQCYAHRYVHIKIEADGVWQVKDDFI